MKIDFTGDAMIAPEGKVDMEFDNPMEFDRSEDDTPVTDVEISVNEAHLLLEDEAKLKEKRATLIVKMRKQRDNLIAALAELEGKPTRKVAAKRGRPVGSKNKRRHPADVEMEGMFREVVSDLNAAKEEGL